MRYEPEQFYLRTAEEMKARFAETPEAVKNTLEVAEKCNLEIQVDAKVCISRFFIRQNISRAKVTCGSGWPRDCSGVTPFAQSRGEGIRRRRH